MKFFDRVKETSTTTGTSAFSLITADFGYRRFSAVRSVGDTVYYTAISRSVEEWEIGLGTYSATNTLTRTTVLASSNGGSTVDFSAGTKDIFGDIPASFINQSLIEASASAPSEVWDGKLWIDITDPEAPILKRYDSGSAAFAEIGGGSSTPAAPVDLSSASTDYTLAVGETAFINFTSATSVPLRVATAEGEYELTIAGDLTISPSNLKDTTLTPNYGGSVPGSNSIYRAAFYNSSTTTVAEYEDTRNTFPLGAGLVINSISKIFTYTKGKSTNTSNIGLYSGIHHNIDTLYWNDTTTAWTSLGMITFPFAQSGKIVVRRLL